MTYRCDADFAWNSPIQEVLKSIEARGGRIHSFEAEGPGGGNPNVVIDFDTQEQAYEFLAEHHAGEDEDWVRELIKEVDEA